MVMSKLIETFKQEAFQANIMDYFMRLKWVQNAVESSQLSELEIINLLLQEKGKTI